MKFKDQLNAYLKEIPANQNELAERSGLSAATISRLCSGKREPAYNSSELESLARALCALADEKGAAFPPYEDVYQSLRDLLDDMLRVDYGVFLENLKYLLKFLGVKNTELAKGIHSDLSHLTRILAGSSNPGDVNLFIHDVSTYLALRYVGSNELGAIAKLLDVQPEDISTSAALRDHLARYLGAHAHIEVDNSIPHFLESLDAFDLNDYLKAVHFDEIKIPSSMPHLPTRREYTGIAKMMESEIDFMKMTVLSRSQGDCILYSDMPLEEMASDPEFPKKYMLGMAMMLKKGLRIHIIHDVNRPFPEMMLGLESWIPLYMTGQITPYYLPASQGQVFNHFLKVSGVAALEGIAIAGNQASGKYVLYRSKEDVKHYRTRAEQLLKKASPLMDIYQKEEADLYRATQKKLFAECDCKLICSNLPLCFLPEDLLKKILERSGLDKEDRDVINDYRAESSKALQGILAANRMQLMLPAIDANAFSEVSADGDKPEEGLPCLSLADVFLDEEIALTKDEYEACLLAIDRLSEEYPNLQLEMNHKPTFHHINIAILGDRAVIVSKEKSPTIHFVIHHKKIIRAFQNFIPPLVED